MLTWDHRITQFYLLPTRLYVCMYPSGMGPAYSGPIR